MQQATNPSNLGLRYYFREILKYQKHFPLLLLFIFLSVVLAIVFPLYLSYATKLLIDDILPNRDITRTLIVILTLGTLLILNTIGSILYSRFTSQLSFYVSSQIRLRLFDAALNGAGIENQNERESNLVSRFGSDVLQLEWLIKNTQWNIISEGIMLVSGTTLLVLFDWRMAIIGSVFFLVATPLPQHFLRRGLKLQNERRNIETQFLSRLKETISVLDVIRLFRLKASRRRGFAAAIKKSKVTILGASEGLSLGQKLSVRVLDTTSFILMCCGIYLVLTSDFTAGRLFGFLALYRIVGITLSGIQDSYVEVKKGAYSLLSIELFLKSQPQRHPRTIHELNRLQNAITFKDVALNIGGKDIVSDVNLTIKSGTSLALVGPSGAGKSTLVNLLLRENELSKGEIYFDNQPLSKVSTSAVLSQFGVVPQEPKLFQGTIRENIGAGKLNATEEEIFLAARKAEIYDEILAFPNGFDTIVKSEGFRPSGGQRQRLTIARALVGNPAIFSFDEAASALDPFADKAIGDTMNSLAGAHTVIFITHRLTSAVFADQIAVLDKGRIVETGKHETLLNAKGLYSQLWEKQNGFILNKKDKTVEVKPSWLKHIPFFSNLDDTALKALADEFLFERKDPDTVILKQGESGDTIYIIASGVVEVSTTDSNTKETTVFAKLTHGDFFGEIALLYDVPRTANVETKSICLFLSLRRQQFNRFLDKAPEHVKADIAQKAQQRLLELTSHKAI